MTDHPSSDRDELVAAYLDGEATPAERAQVEADPELLERAEILSRIATMVSEPVASPPREVRAAHIAAALEASNTAPNVTSLATKRRRFNYTQVAAIAAVVIALFAIPFALSGGDDDDDTVASFDTAATDDAASGDDGAGDDGSSGDGAVAANGDAAFSDDAEEAEADLEPAPAAEPEPEADAEELVAEADVDVTAVEPELLLDMDRFDLRAAPDVDDLEAQVRAELATRTDLAQGGGDDGGDDGAAGGDGAAEEAADDDAAEDDVPCIQDWLASGASPVAVDEVLLVGSSLVAGEPVEYVVVTDGVARFMIVFDENCNERLSEFLN